MVIVQNEHDIAATSVVHGFHHEGLTWIVLDLKSVVQRGIALKARHRADLEERHCDG